MKIIFSLLFFTTLPSFNTGCNQQVSFKEEVKPILFSRCASCHANNGEGIKKSGFSVKNYERIMKGGKYGVVIVPGNSVSSTLYRLIDHKVDPKIQMPPHHTTSLAEGRGSPLSTTEITIIKNWIDQGAKNN